MRISEGGIGAPLVNVLGEVLEGLAAQSKGPIEVTYDELIAFVRATDRFTGISHLAEKERRLEPVGPTRESIRLVLQKKRNEGALSLESGRGRSGLLIVLHGSWDRTAGNWEDHHDPTHCDCIVAGYTCFLHDPEGFRDSHRRCEPPFPCRRVF